MGMMLGKITVETPRYKVLSERAGSFQIREYGSNIVAEVSYEASKNRDSGFMVLANYIGALGNPQNVKPAALLQEGVGAAETIAMTAPVLMAREKEEAGASESIAMTAPVLMVKEEVEVGASDSIAMTAQVLTVREKQEGGASESIAMTAPVLTVNEEQEKEKEKERDDTAHEKKGDVEKKKSSMMTMQFVLPSKYTSLEQVPRPVDSRVRIKEVPPRKYGVVTFNGIANKKLEEEKVVSLKAALEEAGFKVIGPHILAQYNPPWTIPFLRTNEVMLPVE
jgi:hypothetical protein